MRDSFVLTLLLVALVLLAWLVYIGITTHRDIKIIQRDVTEAPHPVRSFAARSGLIPPPPPDAILLDKQP